MEMEWQLDLGNIFVSHKKLLFCVQTRVFLFSPQNYIITYKLRITVAGDNLLLNMTAQFIEWRYIGAKRWEKNALIAMHYIVQSSGTIFSDHFLNV